jgi:DNA-binding NarL/FixJ family response regulator
VSLVLAARNSIVAKGLAGFVEEVSSLVLVGTASDALAAFVLVQTRRPQLVLLDCALFRPLLALLGPQHYRPRILLIGLRRHPGSDVAASRHHACGFVRGGAPPDEVVGLMHYVAHCEFGHPGHARCVACPAQATVRLPRLPLSEREYDIFLRIGGGEGPSGIAKELGVSVKTVEAHRENLKHKLGIDSSHGLLAAAIAWRQGDFDAHCEP